MDHTMVLLVTQWLEIWDTNVRNLYHRMSLKNPPYPFQSLIYTVYRCYASCFHSLPNHLTHCLDWLNVVEIMCFCLQHINIGVGSYQHQLSWHLHQCLLRVWHCFIQWYLYPFCIINFHVRNFINPHSHLHWILQRKLLFYLTNKRLCMLYQCIVYTHSDNSNKALKAIQGHDECMYTS